MEALYTTVFWVLIGVITLPLAALVVFLVFSDYLERRHLSKQRCPACNSPYGRPAARRAFKNGPIDDGQSRDAANEELVFRVRALAVTRPRCEAQAYYYPETRVVSLENNIVLGIPESRRPLPPTGTPS
ncbi:MAG TPA: hypothetical protein PK280_02260 [Planctomycetota bacterium]|nr:hypothetical protein [Planctomycetota bacterium]